MTDGNNSNCASSGHASRTSVLQADWNELWRNAVENSSWKRRGKKDWDEGACEYQRWLDHDDYTPQILNRIDADSDTTVLDIGCGPGNLTIPVAKKVKSITALDISTSMLDRVRTAAEKEGITNIFYMNKEWEGVIPDKDIGKYDVVIASRSVIWLDLREALSRIDRIARQRVYLTRFVGLNPMDVKVYKAIEREYHPMPDYIYLYNLLYQMGIHAHIDIIETTHIMRYPDLTRAMDNWRWRIKDLSPEEEKRLKAHLEQYLDEKAGTGELQMESNWRWALIWWQKHEDNQRSGS